MVEEDAIAGKDVVCLSVVHHNPVAIDLGYTCGTVDIMKLNIILVEGQ